MEDPTRQQFIEGLRDLADFLETNPNAPYDPVMSVSMFAWDEEQLAGYAKMLGNCEKVVKGKDFLLRRNFGPIRYEIYTQRDKVCKPKKVGTKVVKKKVPTGHKVVEQTQDVIEWDCPPSILQFVKEEEKTQT